MIFKSWCFLFKGYLRNDFWMFTLLEINISHLGERKVIFKYALSGDMLIPWRVYSQLHCVLSHEPPTHPATSCDITQVSDQIFPTEKCRASRASKWCNKVVPVRLSFLFSGGGFLDGQNGWELDSMSKIPILIFVFQSCFMDYFMPYKTTIRFNQWLNWWFGGWWDFKSQSLSLGGNPIHIPKSGPK